jgi:type II secretory pathway pseudopilin PulG
VRNSKNRRGFTLVEVLVVLGILICLMGILLPAITHMREEAQRAQCVSNLRQLTLAWLTYAADNERHICSARTEAPVGGAPTWVGPVAVEGRKGLEMGALWSYLNNEVVYRCPDDRTPNKTSYEINGVLAGQVGIPFPIRKLDELTHPVKTFVFIEGCRNNIGPPNQTSGATTLLKDDFKTPIYPKQFTFQVYGFPGGNHKGSSAAAVGTGISFADGHAIFWPYTDPRTGTIEEALKALPPGTKDLGPNSPDVFQLEAWSGGPVPLGVVP